MNYSMPVMHLNFNNVVNCCYTKLNCYQIPAGFSVAGSVRVGNALGAGNPEQAKLSAKITIACAGMYTSACLTVKLFIISSLDTNLSHPTLATAYFTTLLYIWIIKPDYQLLAIFLTLTLLCSNIE